MTQYRKNERGSIMVEVIAVLALMGVMGTLLFRQVARRNEELDNVNLASEIRMVKEATTAYIQAYKTELESKCLNKPDWAADKAAINMFMPETWACDTDGNIDDKTCLINDFNIQIYCYTVDEQMAPRKAFYAIIWPQKDYLPNNFSILRAGRVANLIGSDGGVEDDNTLTGTMGAWEISCDSVACPGYTTYVATTGMDVYVPESETAPENAIAAPKNVAFERLHGTSYFAVGGGTNCIKNYDPLTERFAHQILAAQNGEMNAQDDDIVPVNTTTEGNSGECDPLFWVSTAGEAGNNHSAAGVVYMKNGLHIGRDNAKRRSAVVFDVASGQNPADADNKITVFDPSGNERLTLDGTGRIVGRSFANGTGYRLDPERGEIVMFKTVKIDGVDLQIPTMRLRDGMLESSESATYATGTDATGNVITETKHYNVDPAHTSLMNDIRLASRGGARLSEILPKWILMDTQTNSNTPGTAWNVNKPTCPVGYIRGVVVTPIQFEHRVDSVIIPPLLVTRNASGNLTTPQVDNLTGPNQIRITQNDPLTINIVDNQQRWNITLGYNNVGQGGQIIARADTYCIYRDSPADADSTNGVAHETQSNQGIQNLHAVQPADRVRNCTVNADCANTETCTSGVCTVMGTCTGKDGDKVSGNVYCVNGQQVEISCKKDSDCETGQVCADYRCK